MKVLLQVAWQSSFKGDDWAPSEETKAELLNEVVRRTPAPRQQPMAGLQKH